MGGFYPLQGIGFSTWKQTNPRDVIVFLIGLVIVVIFLIILNSV
jgi:hypothetical protein